MDPCGAYFGEDIVWLRRLQLEYRNAISAVSIGQSYVINGRQVTRANLPDLVPNLQAVSMEIRRQVAVEAGGADPAPRVVYPDFHSSSTGL